MLGLRWYVSCLLTKTIWIVPLTTSCMCAWAPVIMHVHLDSVHQNMFMFCKINKTTIFNSSASSHFLTLPLSCITNELLKAITKYLLGFCLSRLISELVRRSQTRIKSYSVIYWLMLEFYSWLYSFVRQAAPKSWERSGECTSSVWPLIDSDLGMPTHVRSL